MEPYVARAFLNRLLSDDERRRLREAEGRLQLEPKMRARYLQGFEICRLFHLKPDPLPEADTERMSRLLWIWNRQWEQKYHALEKIHSEPFNVNGEHLLGDLWDWERFAEENYVDELPDLSRSA